MEFWKVAIRPGKPFVFGCWREKFLFGLPGNPVSATVTFLLLVRPALLRWQGAASRVFLEEAARQVSARKAAVVNVDSSIIAQQPKLFPHLQSMKTNIASALGIKPEQVGIKATTNEQLGFIGREEGIAAMAVASVELA